MKLSESSSLLESNQQTIAWLNKELNASVGSVAFSSNGINSLGPALKDNFMSTSALEHAAHGEDKVDDGHKYSTLESTRFGTATVNSKVVTSASSRPYDPVDLSGTMNVGRSAPAVVSPPMYDLYQDFTVHGS